MPFLCRRFRSDSLIGIANRYAAEAVLALEYLHACGIVHRDLKVLPIRFHFVSSFHSLYFYRSVLSLRELLLG
jgi:serine/threonine protein kinase